jgi:hypothetical protein
MRVGIVGTDPPTACGVATFSAATVFPDSPDGIQVSPSSVERNKPLSELEGVTVLPAKSVAPSRTKTWTAVGPPMTSLQLAPSFVEMLITVEPMKNFDPEVRNACTTPPGGPLV